MKILVDTHVLIWWVLERPELTAQARTTITARSNEILYSAGSPWEMAIKIGAGRLDIDITAATTAFANAGFARVDIRPAHLAVLITLERLHGDPFDRMIIAQALVEGAAVMTDDAMIARYPIRTIACR